MERSITLGVTPFDYHPSESGEYLIWFTPSDIKRRYVRIVEYSKDDGRWYDECENLYSYFDDAEFMSLIIYPVER